MQPSICCRIFFWGGELSVFKHCLGLLVSAGIVKKARGRIEQKEKFDLALNLEDREICSMR